MSNESKHSLEYISVDRIVPNEWNANEQDEKSFDMLVDDVSETGFIDSLTVAPLEGGNYRIIGGEHRWRAAKALGKDEIPCLVLAGDKWQDEDHQKFVTVRMNMIKGKLNPQKFAKLYREMAEKYGKDQLQKLFGFVDQKEFKRLAAGIVASTKKRLPKELHADLEEKAKDVKTLEDLGKVVQEMYARHGDTMSQSFMILTHGNQDHLYVAMNTPMRKAMDKVVLLCETTGEDINDFMEPVLKQYLKEAVSRLSKIEVPSNRSVENDDLF